MVPKMLLNWTELHSGSMKSQVFKLLFQIEFKTKVQKLPLKLSPERGPRDGQATLSALMNCNRL